MEEERNIITFFCFSGANCNGVGNSEMVYWILCFHQYIGQTIMNNPKSLNP